MSKHKSMDWDLLIPVVLGLVVAAILVTILGNQQQQQPAGPRSGINSFAQQLAASAPSPGGGVLPSIQTGTLSQGAMLWARVR